jgi:hypothetical protein
VLLALELLRVQARLELPLVLELELPPVLPLVRLSEQR